MKNKVLEKKLLGFLKLESGWNFGSGLRIDEDNVCLSIAIIRELDEDIVQKIDVFPTEDSLINLRAAENEKAFGCYIDAKSKQVQCYEEYECEINFLPKKEVSQIINWIKEKYEEWKKQELLGYYQKRVIRRNMPNLFRTQFLNSEIILKKDSKEEFHFSMKSVPRKEAEVYVNTSPELRKNLNDSSFLGDAPFGKYLNPSLMSMGNTHARKIAI